MSDSKVVLEAWLEDLVGHAMPEKSVIGCCVSLAAKSMEAVNGVRHRLDEEGTTASLVGCFASALPISFLAFGPHDPDNVSEFGWSGYRKHGSGALSESKRGADFALVVKLPGDRLRISIFQAKSDWSHSVADGHIKIRQTRTLEDGSVVSQLRTLHDTSCDLMRRKGEKFPGTQHLSWVHYLCQINGNLCCLPLDRIKDQIALELEGRGEPTIKVDSFDAPAFSTVLGDAFNPESESWLEITAGDAEGKVPECIELTELAKLMNLIVSEDGSSSWELLLGSCVKSPLVLLGGAVGKFDVAYEVPSPKGDLGHSSGPS